MFTVSSDNRSQDQSCGTVPIGLPDKGWLNSVSREVPCLLLAKLTPETHLQTELPARPVPGVNCLLQQEAVYELFFTAGISPGSFSPFLKVNLISLY